MNSSYNYRNFGGSHIKCDSNDYDYYASETTQNHDHKCTPTTNNSIQPQLIRGNKSINTID